MFVGLDVLGLGLTGFVEDDVFTGARSRGSTDSREERREAVVVVLTPFFKGMMVTLSTLESNAEEELGSVFDLFVEFLDLAISSDGWVVCYIP
ncbi:MAG: hypothetical protein M2R45_01085 [Verrucomicrobia subdivision 3 bacterium]|nr:hypothetical protein [Limisphaerales bacterium]MCS1414196.1 hypothetical protein [Limisphaerales bacterium]